MSFEMELFLNSYTMKHINISMAVTVTFSQEWDIQ